MAPRQQGLIWNYFKYLSPTDSTLAVCNACGETISRESEDTTKLSNSSMTREGHSHSPTDFSMLCIFLLGPILVVSVQARPLIWPSVGRTCTSHSNVVSELPIRKPSRNTSFIISQSSGGEAPGDPRGAGEEEQPAQPRRQRRVREGGDHLPVRPVQVHGEGAVQGEDSNSN